MELSGREMETMVQFFGGEDQAFSLEHVEFEMPARYPSRDAHRQLDKCIWDTGERSGLKSTKRTIFFFLFL